METKFSKDTNPISSKHSYPLQAGLSLVGRDWQLQHNNEKSYLVDISVHCQESANFMSSIFSTYFTSFCHFI